MSLIACRLRRETVGVVSGLSAPSRMMPLRSWVSKIGATERAFSSQHSVSRSARPFLGGTPSHTWLGSTRRLIAASAAVFAVLAGGEAYFEHLRGSFNQRLMWTPVWATVPMLAAAWGAAVSNDRARRLLPFISAAAFIDGVLGFGLHLRGVRRMPGGLRNLQFNVTMGPPLFAPLLFTAVGLLGFIAALLQRKGK